MTGLQVTEVVMMIVLYDIVRTVLIAIFDFIEDDEESERSMIEWIFNYEDGTEIRRKETMSDDEMIKMYEEHGKVTIGVRESEDKG